MIARSLIFLGMATALVGAVPRAAAAGTGPDHPITIVVPFPARGSSDALRALGDGYTLSIAQTTSNTKAE
jgi:tripartite-type tricarboxylate transporter receptor subunit TctC